MAAIRELRSEYKAAWTEFSRQLDALQRLMDSGTAGDLDCALVNVEKARLAYNNARDRLASQLTGKRLAEIQPPADEKVVRNTARLLWEFAGKPQGTAEGDWLRAERLVRSASC